MLTGLAVHLVLKEFAELLERFDGSGTARVHILCLGSVGVEVHLAEHHLPKVAVQRPQLPHPLGYGTPGSLPHAGLLQAWPKHFLPPGQEEEGLLVLRVLL
jgi:hypothetical protein